MNNVSKKFLLMLLNNEYQKQKLIKKAQRMLLTEEILKRRLYKQASFLAPIWNVLSKPFLRRAWQWTLRELTTTPAYVWGFELPYVALEPKHSGVLEKALHLFENDPRKLIVYAKNKTLGDYYKTYSKLFG